MDSGDERSARISGKRLTRSAFQATFAEEDGIIDEEGSKQQAIGNEQAPTAVPTGTVASRVSYLHSLAASTHNIASTAHHPPPYKGSDHGLTARRQAKLDSEDDRGGYGRRTSARFGYPAHHSEEAREDPADAGHKILGWSCSRSKKPDEDDQQEKRGLRQKVKDALATERRQNQNHLILPLTGKLRGHPYR